MNKSVLLPVIVLLLSAYFGLTCNTAKKTTAAESPLCIGEELFDQKCRSCHSPDTASFISPGLQCATSRMPPGNWRYRFIKNPQLMLDLGDGYSISLKKRYPIIMPAQAVSNADIDSIFAWIDQKYPCKPVTR